MAKENQLKRFIGWSNLFHRKKYVTFKNLIKSTYRRYAADSQRKTFGCALRKTKHFKFSWQLFKNFAPFQKAVLLKLLNFYTTSIDGLIRLSVTNHYHHTYTLLINFPSKKALEECEVVERWGEDE